MQPNYSQIPDPYGRNANQNIPPQYPTGSGQNGGKGTLFALIIVSLLLVSALGFAGWAYMSRQDYKNNTDQKISEAVEVAHVQTATQKDKEFIEKEKSPFKVYESPSNYGSIKITYPKTWAAYVTETDNTAEPVNGYFHPNFVPGSQSGTAFALRVQVVNQMYDQVMRQYENQVKTGKVSVEPFKADKVPNVLGSRLVGEINPGQRDTMIVIPLRDKTMKIWTESDNFLGDFDNTILKELTFVP